MEGLENKSCEELFQMVGEILQAATMRQAKDILDKEGADLENRIVRRCQLENEIAKKDQLQLELDKVNLTLESCMKKNKDLEGKNNSLQTENSRLADKNNSLQMENDDLHAKLSEAQGRLADMQNKLENEQVQYQGYRRACDEQISGLLPFIDTSTYEAYVMSICDQENISLIFRKMRDEYECKNLKNVEKYDRLIDDHIKIGQKIYGQHVQLRRQDVRSGQFYESAQFDKVSYSNENGKISKVLYQGIEKNGRVWIKSLVEVE